MSQRNNDTQGDGLGRELNRCRRVIVKGMGASVRFWAIK